MMEGIFKSHSKKFTPRNWSESWNILDLTLLFLINILINMLYDKRGFSFFLVRIESLTATFHHLFSMKLLYGTVSNGNKQQIYQHRSLNTQNFSETLLLEQKKVFGPQFQYFKDKSLIFHKNDVLIRLKINRKYHIPV